MFSTLETIAIIGIIIVQLIIAVHAYRQIAQMKSFLPEGRKSLVLKEYVLPTDRILELDPSQVVDKNTYDPSKVEESDSVKEEHPASVQPRDEKGRFTSKRTDYSPIPGEVDEDNDDDYLPF